MANNGLNNGNNFGKKIGNLASKARKRANNGKNFDVMDPGSENPNVKAAKKNVGKAAGKAVKKIGKAIGKALKSLVQALIKAGPWGWFALAIIIILLIVVAIVTSLNVMPGMMKAKLAELFKINVGSWFMNGAVSKLESDYSDIIDVTNYLESMNYSLVGDGFVTPKLRTDSDIKTLDEILTLHPEYVYKIGTDGKNHIYYEDFSIEGLDEIDAKNLDESKRIPMKYYNNLGQTIINSTGEVENTGDYYTDEFGIIRSTEAREDGDKSGRGQVAKINKEDLKNYRLLRTYLLSNYRIYTLKNADEDFFNDLGSLFMTHFGGNQDAWAKGLIKLYNAQGGIASGHWWWGQKILGDVVKIEGTTLSLKKGWFNNAMKFNIEGWAPRYGLSLDFLLALHLGTGAPDLVNAMLQNFDIEVQVYLDDSGEAKVDARYVDPKNVVSPPTGVSIDTIKSALADYNFGINGFFINDAALTEFVNGIFLTRGACAELFKKVPLLMSQDTCTYAVTDYVIIDITGGVETITYPDFFDYFRSGVNFGELDGKDVLQKLYGYDDPDLADIEYDKTVDAGTDDHYAYNRSTSLMSYKLEHGLTYEDEIDYDTAYSEAMGDRNRIRNLLLNEWNMPSYYESSSGVMVPDLSPQTTYADPEPQLNGKVYEIVMNKEATEWDVFLDEDGNIVDQANILNEEASNEAEIGYSSYVYTVYEAGVVNPDGTIQKYEDGGVQQEGEPSRVEVGRFTYAHHQAYEYYYTVDTNRPTYTVVVYYNPDREGQGHYELECICTGEESMRVIKGWEVAYEAEDGSTYYRAKYFDCYGAGATDEVIDDINSPYWDGPYVYINEDESSNLITISYGYGNTDLIDAEDSTSIFGAIGTGEVNKEYSLSDVQEAYENGRATLQNEKILRDVLYINVAVREKTIEELIECGILNEDGTPTGEVGKCSEEARGPNGDDFKKTCKACQKYLRAVTAALASVSDQDYSSYTPYIARVVGSWFRDTYFITPKEADAAITEYAGYILPVPASYTESDGSGGQRTVTENVMSTKHPEFNVQNTYSDAAQFVEVDEEYLGDSGEYWTAYVMQTDENDMETDKYQLYVLKANGITSNTKMEDFLRTGEIDEVPATINGQLIGSNPYGPVTTEEEIEIAKEKAEEAGWAFVKKAKLIYFKDFAEEHTAWEEQSTEDRIDADKILWSAYAFDSNGSATNWEKVLREDGNREVNKLYDIIYGEESDGDEDSGVFYQLSKTNNVTQVEDAQRGETNPLVKYLFKYRKFYLYDGSENTGLAIEHDRQRVLYGYQNYVDENYDFENRFYNTKEIADEHSIKDVNLNNGEFLNNDFYHYKGLIDNDRDADGDLIGTGILINSYYGTTGTGWKSVVIDKLNNYGRSALRETYAWHTKAKNSNPEDLISQWLDWQLDMYYMDKYGVDLKAYYKTNENLLKIKYDPRDPDLIGTVQITKSSLSVFSMLENTGSLDADYAYRDFKELIVELNYFDKEDLSSKIETVFTWVLPETSAAGWPVRPWDKLNVDYGTLIQSHADYEALGVFNGTIGNVDESTIFWVGDSWIMQLGIDDTVSENRSEGGTFSDLTSMGGLNNNALTKNYFFGLGALNANDALDNYTLLKNQIEERQVSCIAVGFGLNNPSGDGKTQELIDKLHMDFPNIPIYALKASHVGVARSGAGSLNSNVDGYNNRMKSYCEEKSYCSYVDWSTEGIWDSDGYLSDTDDEGIHMPYYSDIKRKWYNNIISEMGASRTTRDSITTPTSSSSEGNQELLNVAYEVAETVHTYSYLGAETGNYTFPIKNRTTLSCSSFVSECLYQAGYEDEIRGQQRIYARNSVVRTLTQFLDVGIEVKGFVVLENECSSDIEELCNSNNIELIKVTKSNVQEYLLPGDICFDIEGSYVHTYFYVESGSGNNFSGIGFPEMHYATAEDDYVSVHSIEKFHSAVRLVETEKNNNQAGNNATAFEGFIEGDAIVSPVTGRILEIGKHERLNVYTGEMEEVEYITIQIMDSGDYFQSRMGTVDEDTAKEKYGYETATEYDVAQALDLFYKEYSDVCIQDNTGYTITIDGFDVELLQLGEDENISALTDEEIKEKLNAGVYEQNEVYALYNSEQMEIRKQKEQAKDDAPFFINCGETAVYPGVEYTADPDSIVGYYIKEGKYIGKAIEPHRKAMQEESGEGEDTPTPTPVPDAGEEQQEENEEIDKLTYTYADFKEMGVPGDYIRIIIHDKDYALVDDVERFFNIPEMNDGGRLSDADLDIDLLTLLIDSWENASVMDYILGVTNEYKTGIFQAGYYVTQDKKYFINFCDLPRTRNYGPGVCHQPDVFTSPDLYYHIEEYKSVGVDITHGHHELGTKCEVSKVLKVQSMLIQNTFIAGVETRLERAGIVLEQHQKDALVDTAYQYGCEKIDEFVAAYNNGDPESFFRNHTEYVDRWENRLHLYQTGEYLGPSGIDLKEKLKSLGGSITSD